jgi:hypothetical protein
MSQYEQWMTPEQLAAAYDPHSGASQENPGNFYQYGAAPIEHDPAWAQSLGYNGPMMTGSEHITEGGGGDYMPTIAPELQQYLSSKGYTQKLRYGAGNQVQRQYFDASGKPVGMQRSESMSDPEFQIAAAIAMAIMTGGASAAGLGSMGSAVGSSMGAEGAFGTALGNAAISTGMGAVTGQSPSLGTAASLAGSYMNQGGTSFDTGSSFDSGSISPDSFSSGQGQAMDWSDLNLGDSVDTSGLGTGADTGGWLGNYNLDGSDTNLGQYGSGWSVGNMGSGSPYSGQLGDYNLSGGGNQISNWWDKVKSGDPNAIKTGLNYIGALSSLFQDKSKGRNSLTPDQLRSMLKGPYNDFNSGQMATVNHYFASPVSPQYQAPNVNGIVPLTQQGAPAAGGHASIMPVPNAAARFAQGGAVPGVLARLAGGGSLVQGPGGGQDDQVQARLSPGEYVFDADSVAALGDGNNAEGARRLDEMRMSIREHKRSAPPDAIPPKAKGPLSYLKGGRRG